MTTELETGLPSIRFVQKLIREDKEVELQLLTNEKLTGRLRWQDPHCLCLLDLAEQTHVIWRQAIVYLKPKS